MIKRENMTKGYLLVGAAGICWGTTGTLARSMMSLGVNSQGVSFIRMFFGFLALLMFISFKDINVLKIDKKGLFITAVMGLVTQTFFNLAFFNSISLIGVASATVLLYLSPVFLLIWSVLFFKEKVNILKLIGIGVCVIGSYFAITGGSLEFKDISFLGVLLGISSAFSYSTVSVFSKFALKKYNSEVLVLYSFMFGFIFTIPFAPIGTLISLAGNYKFILLSLGLGTLSSSVAYVLYFNGISTGIELSKAGVISILELIVSIILSVALIGENLSFPKVIGILIIIISIVIIQNSNIFDKKKGSQVRRAS